MVQKYPTIFRAVNNFIQVGEDGKTRAMRLGLTNHPLSYKEILWPEKARPKRACGRRKRVGDGEYLRKAPHE